MMSALFALGARPPAASSPSMSCLAPSWLRRQSSGCPASGSESEDTMSHATDAFRSSQISSTSSDESAPGPAQPYWPSRVRSARAYSAPATHVPCLEDDAASALFS